MAYLSCPAAHDEHADAERVHPGPESVVTVPLTTCSHACLLRAPPTPSVIYHRGILLLHLPRRADVNAQQAQGLETTGVWTTSGVSPAHSPQAHWRRASEENRLRSRVPCLRSSWWAAQSFPQASIMKDLTL